jgi:hypothetical protein
MDGIMLRRAYYLNLWDTTWAEKQDEYIQTAEDNHPTKTT